MASGGYGTERRGGVRTAFASSCSAVQQVRPASNHSAWGLSSCCLPGNVGSSRGLGGLARTSADAESAAPAFRGRRASRSFLRRQASPPSVKASLGSDHERRHVLCPVKEEHFREPPPTPGEGKI